MKRHVVAGIALLGMAGCAQERTAQRPAQGYPSAVGLPPEVAPITQTINQGLPPPDRATVLASTGVGANKGPAQGRPIAPAVAPNRIAAGPSRSAEPPAGAAPSLPGPTLSTSLVAPPAGAPA
ncbi:MAG: hypothetical protein P4L84_08090, partial [Isosphaeraceae bacterium]|nr:hypothetical protein [Isosphaeraceae bacterium]